MQMRCEWLTVEESASNSPAVMDVSWWNNKTPGIDAIVVGLGLGDLDLISYYHSTLSHLPNTSEWVRQCLRYVVSYKLACVSDAGCHTTGCNGTACTGVHNACRRSSGIPRWNWFTTAASLSNSSFSIRYKEADAHTVDKLQHSRLDGKYQVALWFFTYFSWTQFLRELLTEDSGFTYNKTMVHRLVF